MQAFIQLYMIVFAMTSVRPGLAIVIPPTDHNKVCTTKECDELAKRILDAMDKDKDPCDDFYDFVCAKWASKAKIPPGRTAMNRFVETAMEVEKNMEHSIKSWSPRPGPQTPRDKMATLFRICKRTDITEEQDIRHLKDVLKDSSFASWPRAHPGTAPIRQSGVLMTNGWHGLFGISVEPDVFHFGKHGLYMDVPRFKPLSEQAFRDLNERGRLKYKSFINDVLKKIHPELIRHIDTIAGGIYQFELEIMRSTTMDSLTRGNNYIVVPLKDLDNTIPGLQWKEIIKHKFNFIKIRLEDSRKVVVWRSVYYKDLTSKIRSKITPEVLFNYLGWKLVVELIPYTRKKLYDIHSEFMQSVDPSFNKMPPEDTCIKDLMSNMKYIFGKLYVTAYFDEQSVSDVS
ncbi:unnamed protein product, partial [Ixodes hexagonus]